MFGFKLISKKKLNQLLSQRDAGRKLAEHVDANFVAKDDQGNSMDGRDVIQTAEHWTEFFNLNRDLY